MTLNEQQLRLTLYLAAYAAAGALFFVLWSWLMVAAYISIIVAACMALLLLFAVNLALQTFAKGKSQ